MALAKDHRTPASPFYVTMLETGSPARFRHISTYRDYNQQNLEDLESPNSNKIMSNHQVINHSPPPLSSASSGNSSNGFTTTIHHSSNYQPHEEAQSLINFKSGYKSLIHNNSRSFLSFQHEGQSANQTYQKQCHISDYNHHLIWDGSITNQQQNQLKQIKNSSSNSILDEVNHLQSAGSDYQDASNEWLFNEAYVVDPPQESKAQQTCFNKRPHMEEESIQASNKKQCTSNSLKKPTKSKTTSTTKDPQSIAARNRRERISERLKTLQDLVPNGSKVDLVTMLEKAIGYVKFLQLQVKVLATDEFWPAAGGKAPDISQVKQAIDAILTSSRSSEGTSTCSK